MIEPIENLYFNWLYAKVNDPRRRSPSLNFDTLLGELHRIEFVWLLSGDDNRAEDGCDLRVEFLRESYLDVNRNDPWFLDPCSVLEMLIAFARIAAFETDDILSNWFWKMMENLHLSDFHDGANPDVNQIHEIVSTFIWRTYDFNGDGGLFPLRRTQKDQRKVEVWYQFNEYLAETDPL